MSGANGGASGPPRSLGEGYQMLQEAVNSLKSTMLEELKATRGEIKVLSSRFDGLASEVRTTRTIVDQMVTKVHRSNNLMQIAINQAGEIYHSRLAFERGLVKLDALEKIQELLERDLDVLAERTRRLRSEVADQVGPNTGDPQ